MTVKRRPDGRWLADCQPIRGQRFRKLFKTKAEALRYEAYINANKAVDPSWNPKSPDRRRLSELVDLWFDLHGHMLKDGKRRKSKLDALCVRLRNPVAALLDPSTYAHDRRIRAESGTTPKTLNNELGYLRAVYNELRGLGQIEYDNPLRLVKPFRIEERELSWLTDDQITFLLDAIRSGCDNPHVEPIVLLCLATGARWTEAETRTPANLKNGSVTFTNTKSSKARTVPISPELEAFLRNHWKRHGPFTGAITSFRRALARSGITLPKGQASHALRHSFASHFIQKGGNILTLQKILGHSSLAMTMRYAHLAPDHLKDAIKFAPIARII
ncbi:tyrosine-type recombinase/integrase [Halopseudomonas pelagia]|uniref:Integrase n=1 Tax=Halopseudomonas pelagia TaxID=553151 RepID=A0AA91Z7T3_9GAMM|nr:tyrosine-type recombinase/integrase [Halopseudomonas pelagia]PCD01075.1 integrase [Halopseudomonas pelagia]QFY55668.1 integrase [Halopseudomonas pelagia]